MKRRIAVAAALLPLFCGPLRAQRVERTEFSAPNAGIAFIASAVLPGAGQYYVKAERWPPYLAVEGWAWMKYLQRRAHGRDMERRYRDLAWSVARRIGTETRRDSVFTYYEAIGQYRESGLYDADPVTSVLDPEPDTSTFNGVTWKRARALFFRGSSVPQPGTPEYERALAYYRANAIPAGYVWSWRNSELEHEEFKEAISRSDEAFRSATRMLGVILANHLVSAVDALVLARVQALSEHRIRLGSALEPAGSGYIWMTTVRIPIGAHSARIPREDN
ncbi:MAG TPA: hypothetical protein VFO52_09645 [Longimicrobiales bacterium]|nr:hypothetical protein [Longimicrobiales bacterium]